MFDQIGSRIWSHEATYRLGALAIPHRVTALQGEDGSLTVHSPAKPDEFTLAALSELGVVRSVVWPSWWHDLYVRAWSAAFPGARLYVAPQLQRAVERNPNATVLSESAMPSSDLEGVYVDALSVWLDEFVFLHRPSRTLIVADLVVNVRQDMAQPARTFFAVLGAYPGPRIPWFYPRVSRDRRRLRKAFSRILDWDFDALVMGHGDVIRSGARAAFAAAVDRLHM